MALALASCGGGDGGNGGGGNGGGGSTNTAPAFSSAAGASVAENATAVAYQATATDAQGDAITFTISGGADASAFTITPGGALSFTTPPNYDLPTDADGNNIYQVTIQASDGKASSTLAVSITVTNDREGIRVTRVGQFEGAVDIASVETPRLDGHPNLLVAFANGTILQMAGADGSMASYANITGQSPTSTVTLLGLTRARAIGSRMATYILAREGTQVRVVCVGCLISPISGSLADVADGSSVALGTGPDGAAYIAVGDAAGTRAQGGSADRHGKLYRYSLHPDPYAGASLPEDLYLKELIGLGLREPVGIGAIPDRLVVSDRGDTMFDEISTIFAKAENNFGWPYFEGTYERAAGGAGLWRLVTPQVVIPRGSGQRQSRGIIGGALYTGAIAGIRNHYVFADKDGRIWSFPGAKIAGPSFDATSLELRNEDFRPDQGKIDHPVSIKVDNLGDLYILDSDGELFRVENADGGGSIIISPSP